MIRFIQYSTLMLCSLFLLGSCDLEREIDVDVDHVSELVVQGFITDGETARVTLQNSTSIEDPFDASFLNQFVDDAAVSVVVGTQRIDLVACNKIDPTTGFFFNYSSPNPISVMEGEALLLEVTLADGTFYTASSSMPPSIQLDSIIVDYQADIDMSNYITYVTDGPIPGEFFRTTSILRRGELIEKEDDGVIDDFWFDDEILEEESFPFQITLFEYEPGDTIINISARLTNEYERYLTSIDASIDANGNPFGQPGTIITNIEGPNVTGVFTGLSFVRDTIIFGTRDTVIRF